MEEPVTLDRFDREPTPLAPGSVMWDVAGDVRLFPSFLGALLLHTMLPAIGTAVGEYSAYRTDPWGRAQRSIDSVQLWVYGGDAALAEGRRLRELHKDVKGVDNHGHRYQANNNESYSWVHNSLFERLVTMREKFGEPLTPSQQDRMYDDFLQIGANQLIPSRYLPGSISAYWEYFDDMVANRLEAHPTTLDIMQVVRHDAKPMSFVPAPIWPAISIPLSPVSYLLMVGTLRQDVRDILGIEWTSGDQRRFDIARAAIRVSVSALPERLRYFPYAYATRLTESTRQKMANRALTSVTR